MRRRSRSLAALAFLALLLMLGACTSGSDEPDDGATDSKNSLPDGSEPSDDEPSDADSQQDPEPITVFTGASGYSNQSPDYFGNPIWATGPANVPVDANTSLAIRFAARQSGSIERASFNIKFDFERAGYHGGDCGDLEVTLRTDDAGVPGEELLGRMVFTDPCGGAGDIGHLVDAPFETPVQVIGGEVYHLVFSNLDPDPGNFVSINLLNWPDDRGAAYQLATGDGVLAVQARGSTYWSGSDTGQWGRSEVLETLYPAFELHYDDEVSQGVSYIGARFGSEVTLAPGATNRIRQLFTPTEDVTLSSAWFRGVEFAPGTALDLRIAQLDEPSDDPNDDRGDGITIYTGSLAAPTGTEPWFGGALSATLTFRAGVTYSAEAVATAGSMIIRPLYQAEHNEWISSEQSDWADSSVEVTDPATGTWGVYVGSIPHNLSLYFDRLPSAGEADTGQTDPDETNPDDTNPDDTSAGAAVVGEAVTVAVYGDSLVGEADFDAALEASLDARSFALVGKDNESGRTAAALLPAIEANPLVADVYVINIGINGEESGAAFRSAVEAALSRIRQLNPDAVVLWSSLHALPIKISYIVTDRVDPRNVELDALAAAGQLILVPWAQVAAANPQIYVEDGVHYFGSEDLYVSTVIAALDRTLAAG